MIGTLSKRLSGFAAATLTSALIFAGGVVSPAVAVTTVDLTVPFTLPSGVNVRNLSDNYVLPELYRWVADGSTERLEYVMSTSSVDASSMSFFFEDVPAADDYVLYFDGYDLIAEEFWDGATTTSTAQRFSTKNSGSSKTLSQWTLDAAPMGTVKVPVTFPSTTTVNSSTNELNQVTLYRYGAVFEDDGVISDGWQSVYGEQKFDVATSTFTFDSVKGSSAIIAQVDGRFILPTFVGGETEDSAHRVALTAVGQEVTFPTVTPTAAKTYTVEIPFEFPAYMTPTEIIDSMPDVFAYDSRPGNFTEGTFDSARNTWVAKYIRESTATSFHADFYSEYLAGGIAVGSRDYSTEKNFRITGTESVIKLPKWKVPTWSELYPERPLVNTFKPTISGSPITGKTLTVNAGQWIDDYEDVIYDASFKYQWNANNKPIAGATASKFVVPASLRGQTITVTVKAFARWVAHGTSTSAPTSKVVTPAEASRALAVTQLPKVTGTVRVGAKLSIVPAKWNISGVTVKNQWLVNGVAVKGATKTTFTVPASAVGKTISVRSTASSSGVASVTAASSKTKKVAKSTATVSGKLAKTSIKKTKSTSITVTVKTPGVSRPTGTVTVKVGSKSVKAKIKSSHKGKIKVTLKGSKLKTAKRQKVTVSFTPSGSTAKAVKKSKTTKVSKTLTVAK